MWEGWSPDYDPGNPGLLVTQALEQQTRDSGSEQPTIPHPSWGEEDNSVCWSTDSHGETKVQRTAIRICTWPCQSMICSILQVSCAGLFMMPWGWGSCSSHHESDCVCQLKGGKALHRYPENPDVCLDDCLLWSPLILTETNRMTNQGRADGWKTAGIKMLAEKNIK